MSDIVIISSDIDAILKTMEDVYKENSAEIFGEEKQLEKSEPRWIDYQVVAALVSNIKSEMNDAAKQNYLRYARGERLDAKGEFYGDRGARQQAEVARTTMKCNIQAIQNREIIIPAGTRFIKDDYLFKTIEEYKISVGLLFVEAQVEATVAGFCPEYAIGEITQIVDPYDFYDSCANTTVVKGGVDASDDEAYKQELQLIPESYSTAGPAGSYEYWSYKHSDEIKEVFIDNPQPNYVDVYVIGENGEFVSEEIKQSLLDFLSGDTIRPQGDIIDVKDPLQIEYTIDFTYFIYKKDETRALEIKNNITLGINDYVLSQNEIGKDINPQDIVSVAISNGAKRVEILEPSVYISVNKNEIPKNTSINIIDGGIEL